MLTIAIYAVECLEGQQGSFISLGYKTTLLAADSARAHDRTDQDLWRPRSRPANQAGRGSLRRRAWKGKGGR